MNKKAMINKIDVEYRDIQNIDNQYHVMKAILNSFNDKHLKAILKFTKEVKKLDKLEQ
tara:strand:+ start:520 stop:693 length:174 start_codon:yes stop_codon:yes gene_type:complete